MKFIKSVLVVFTIALGISSTFCADSKFKTDFTKQDINTPAVNVQTGVANLNLKGTGVSNGVIVIPPCMSTVPHYHPGATESNTAIQGQFDYFILDAQKNVTTGTASRLQIVNYPQGLPHMQFNPYRETAVIMVTTNTENPGVFPLSSFTNFDDTAVITGLGQDYQTYGPFKYNVLATKGAPVTAAKGDAYTQCLQRLGLPVPTVSPTQGNQPQPIIYQASPSSPTNGVPSSANSPSSSTQPQSPLVTPTNPVQSSPRTSSPSSQSPTQSPNKPQSPINPSSPPLVYSPPPIKPQSPPVIYKSPSLSSPPSVKPQSPPVIYKSPSPSLSSPPSIKPQSPPVVQKSPSPSPSSSPSSTSPMKPLSPPVIKSSPSPSPPLSPSSPIKPLSPPVYIYNKNH